MSRVATAFTQDDRNIGKRFHNIYPMNIGGSIVFHTDICNRLQIHA